MDGIAELLAHGLGALQVPLEFAHATGEIGVRRLRVFRGGEGFLGGGEGAFQFGDLVGEIGVGGGGVAGGRELLFEFGHAAGEVGHAGRSGLGGELLLEAGHL